MGAEEGMEMDDRTLHCGEGRKVIIEGAVKFTPWFCDNHRDCERCRRAKEHEIRKVIIAQQDTDPVYCARITEDRARAIVRKHGRAAVLRIPQSNGDVLQFCTSWFDGATEFDGYVHYDWDTIIRDIPVASRVSGYFGRAV